MISMIAGRERLHGKYLSQEQEDPGLHADWSQRRGRMDSRQKRARPQLVVRGGEREAMGVYIILTLVMKTELEI